MYTRFIFLLFAHVLLQKDLLDDLRRILVWSSEGLVLLHSIAAFLHRLVRSQKFAHSHEFDLHAPTLEWRLDLAGANVGEGFGLGFCCVFGQIEEQVHFWEVEKRQRLWIGQSPESKDVNSFSGIYFYKCNKDLIYRCSILGCRKSFEIVYFYTRWYYFYIEILKHFLIFCERFIKIRYLAFLSIRLYFLLTIQAKQILNFNSL